MPKRTDIKKILIIGAGPIVISQACEFDYSGSQACKALREEGYEVILINSNPATIMTDPNMSDRTYIEPVTAEAVAKKTGISNFKAGMLPSDKADFIKSLQNEGKIVGMVGDGINDSQALATAEVSIAMGKGSDIAIDAAKMTIISSDLSIIPFAIRLSRNTVKTIRQNLFWAFIYNIIGIPLAAGILFPVNGFLLNPMIAGSAMAMSSISVVSNSLRLKWSK